MIQGRIYAGQKFNQICEAVGISGGRIRIIGENNEVESACNQKTRIVNLNKRAVIPGFIDAHTHFIQMGVDALHLNLSRVKSLRSLLQRVRNRSTSTPDGEWILGSGWDESKWPENRYPTSQDLDPASRKNPVWLRRVDGHMGIANELALVASQIPQSTRGFEVNDACKPTGVLREDAMEMMEEKVRAGEKMMLRGLRKAVTIAHRLGVTSIHDMAEPEHIQLYRSLFMQRGLGVRVYLNFFASSLQDVIESGQKTGYGDEHLKLGALKLFADGSIGARTAALWAPYTDAPGETGMLVHNQRELTRLVKQADTHEIQLAIHCIGDRGINAALTALEEGCSKSTLKERRHRLEHFELVEPEALRRASKLWLILSTQPNYVDLWSRSGGLYERRLGRERVKSNNLFRNILEAGLPIAFGSDCMPFSPLYGVYSAVNAPLETQRLDARDSVACYTAGGAYGSFDEDVKGTIDVGKLADLVVLSQDPFENPESLSSVRVDMTIFDGRVVYVRRNARDLIA